MNDPMKFIGIVVGSVVAAVIAITFGAPGTALAFLIGPTVVSYGMTRKSDQIQIGGVVGSVILVAIDVLPATL